MPAQYLVLQDSALEAQNAIALRKFGHEVWSDGEYVKPFRTKQPFKIIHHPTSAFSAIEIPEKIPYGMKTGEDWCRGKPRTIEGATVQGRPGHDETIDNLWPTNRPLKSRAELEAAGWFPEDEI